MQFPAYSEFNNYLTETKLNDEINSRQPVTVLVFNNSLVKEFLSDEPLSVVKVALSIHILLDYFDKQKLMAINDGSTITTTLYQTTGNAVGGTGHVNITDLVGNKVGFGSDANGSRLDALYERSLKQIPYNISIMEISDSVMIDSGMDASRVESTILDSVPISILKIDQVLFPAGFYVKPPYPTAVPVPESFPPSPSAPGSATVHPPITSPLAPVAITSPIISPPAPPASPTSSPFSGPAPAENPAADTRNNNSSGGIKAPAIFLALATLSLWVYMISSIVS
ncbi:hypothetical protein E3N88_07893 [Mikania micrantha]|uniref:FAS1 domain-containing protein n=1 Tax=Mikania micrantha TaxID=192012 RepID=A0A5N6PFS4_9ASTR|nr:hypothetical protein E3N88_07893 [Mikania micrantha]